LAIWKPTQRLARKNRERTNKPVPAYGRRTPPMTALEKARMSKAWLEKAGYRFRA
jgi:hypothetical protein